ncbi:MAG: cupin domain-containing protein [Gammaproteobacteria bacterium]
MAGGSGTRLWPMSRALHPKQFLAHQGEHWIVVSGTSRVTNGDKTFLLCENESTYIPIGVVHALENIGKVELELIEVQTGSYFGEDDIVRFEDNYGRVDLSEN